MKRDETDYINELFAEPAKGLGEKVKADATDSADFPLLDVPAGLNERLLAIPRAAHRAKQPGRARGWPKLSSIAASLLVVVVLGLVYQQQQTIKQLERAQTDLATALHYLGEANRITQVHMRQQLNSNLKNTTVRPVVEVGRDAMLQTAESLQAKPLFPSRRL